MAVIRQLKGLWGVTGTLRQISDVVERPLKAIYESVSLGLPQWDPPAEGEPRAPDQATVDRVQEVIGMGTVEERNAYEKVVGQWRKITTGQPRETPAEGSAAALPAGAPPKEATESENGGAR